MATQKLDQPNFAALKQPMLNNLKYGWQLLRCKDWSVQNGIFLLGAFFADNLLHQGWLFVSASLILSCLCLGYAYSLNEFYDELRDKLTDQPQTFIGLLWFIYALLTLALVLSWWIAPMTLAMVILIGITVWMHSSPPLVLKRNLFWRLFLNSLGFALFFLAGASLDDHLSPEELSMGLFIFGLYLPLELIHVLAHMDSDRAKNFPTIALIYGERTTLWLAISFLAVLILYSILLCVWNFVSALFCGWCVAHLSLLAISLAMFFYRNTGRTYADLRLLVKIVCAVFGAGLLAILFLEK